MTEPVKEVLPRNEKSGAEELLSEFADGIEEVVNYGTHLLDWELKKDTGGDENLPAIMMFRHFLELIDSVSILVRQSSIDPCKPLLRSALETLLGFEYLLQAETKKKALGFLIWHYYKELKLCKKLLPGEEANKQLEKKFKADKSTSHNFKPPVIDNLGKHIKLLEEILALPLYAEAKAEYQKLIAAGNKNPNWYQLYDGPKNVEQLATQLSRQTYYEVLYRGWSGPTHGTEIIQGKLASAGNGKAFIIQIRSVKDAQQITMYAFILSLAIYQIMIDQKFPEKKIEHAKWYMSIRDLFLRVTGKNLITVA